MKVLKGVFFAIVIFFGFILICGILAEDKSTEEKNEKYDLQFYLEAGTKGEYGRILTYNDGTEFEENMYAYYVPSGKYIVTNKGSYSTQINVYSNDVHIVNGFEEPKEGNSYLLKKNSSIEITVKEGFHIEIQKPTYIFMERIKK